MVEKNLKKLQAKKRRVTNGFNTGTRDMKLKTAYRRNKRWSADDSADRFLNRPWNYMRYFFFSYDLLLLFGQIINHCISHLIDKTFCNEF